jgi:hypothetical protein
MLDLESRLTARAQELQVNERRRRWRQEWKEGAEGPGQGLTTPRSRQPAAGRQPRSTLVRFVSAFARRP